MKALVLPVLMGLLMLLPMLAACRAAGGGRTEKLGPVPQLKQWEANMLSFGAKMKQKALQAKPESVGTDGAEDVTFYDGARVFYRIADYTKDPSWNEAAKACVKLYRDVAVLPNNGKVPGWRIFAQGLEQDYRRTKDEKSKQAVLLLAKNAAFAPEETPLEWTASEALSREVAYNLNSYLAAMRLGEPRPARLSKLYEQALGHLDQWFVKESCDNYAPFMFALTAEALITYYEQVEKDPRIVTGLKRGCDWTWKHAWMPKNEAFWYRLNEQSEASTVNLLIAPVYAWVALRTGERTYLDEGDQVFAGGVKHGYLDGGKFFNQNYHWSFAYLKWREEFGKRGR